jgi:hypothetical protein
MHTFYSDILRGRDHLKPMRKGKENIKMYLKVRVSEDALDSTG